MRSVNRVASLLLTFTLLAGGAMTVVETALVVLRRPPLLIDRNGWYEALTSTRLDAPVVRLVAIAVTVAGLLILFAELRRWRPDRLAVCVDDDWYVRRRAVERRLARVAEQVPGVAGVRVRVHRRGSAWRLRVHGTGDPALRSAVATALGSELNRLSAPPRDRLDIDLTRRRGSG